MSLATRCYSSSLIRLLQSRVRGRGLPCLTPLAGGVVTGQESGCTSLTNGRCRDCLVWNVDEAFRIERPFWSETTVTTAVLPWRAASNAYVQPPARNARLTTQMRQPPVRKENKLDATDDKAPSGKTTCPRPSMEHGTLRPYAKCWCAVCTCSTRYDTLQRKREQRHGTLPVHA